MPLFAVTDIPGARIIRFNLTQPLEAEVASAFEEQCERFKQGIVSKILFDGRYVPEEGELLYIDNFVDVEGMAQAAADPLRIDLFDPTRHSLERVKALFVQRNIDGVDCILVQFFERRRLLSKRGAGLRMVFNDGAFHRFDEQGVTLDTRLLAVLEGSRLYFQSFHFLSRALDMAEYFREATAAEVKEFAKHRSFQVENPELFADRSSNLVRKKIAQILQSGVLEKFTPQQIVQVAGALNLTINLNAQNQIIMPEGAAEIRQLLRFLEEDYYESSLTQTLFLSNSKRVAN